MNRPEREHPRYAHEAMITFHAPGGSIAGRTCNVSCGGLCALMTEAIAVGSAIEVDLQLVFSEDQHSEALRLPARIVWCTAIDDHHQLGVRFLPFDESTKAYLTMFLRYLGRDAADAETAAISLDDRFG